MPGDDDRSSGGGEVGPVVYEGPFGDVLKKIKIVSVFSCGCTMLGMPVLAAARQYSAEDFFRLNVPRCTAMGWILIPAYCSANP